MRSLCSSLVASHSVNAGTPFTLAVVLCPWHTRHQTLIDFSTSVHASGLVNDFHEALTTFTGVPSESVDTASAAQGGIQTAEQGLTRQAGADFSINKLLSHSHYFTCELRIGG